MEKAYKEKEPEDSLLSSASIYEIPGEPAVVINGVPNVTQSENTVPNSDSSHDVEPKRDIGFGEWLEGREVRKLFGEQFYYGSVTRFDRETGWYRVVYNDGDFEDLEWHELKEVIQPLDITVPLKTLALRIAKKSEKSICKSENNAIGFGSTTRRVKNVVGWEGKPMQGPQINELQ
ncbi:PREDICTED: dirigent protein 17-like [Nelumbo nucifera]|uniref:Dirigent protein 17-like n=2 Tax=Nelumbo nucifera TaxID=4432 RepID=A0A1U8B2N5_NELNU|nr:PREDICTED: dirigent protein 17-like [Nelumbo nucifera]XP_010275043.1 PREDICTED: dirigent protein 17-like [Nelumbo nucifera]XP_010275044.1 PREDICTED: dirigent protein 17-like [Nelumbo nucifera]XP_010275046.1 PREDICTED: dirigent protein 17-like [Nelumbo nucifera]XP_010275047.1 PREDICTED: dirigent protein 17-like [Nelumbo nucifera]XP_010275048.1 PREDICTED: dirigent protein 17-like [Nelumbo nucifera]DAD37296.1 TPA_asm: hypothetical protein HUJ06_007937 [Nelumbo nucifera]